MCELDRWLDDGGPPEEEEIMELNQKQQKVWDDRQRADADADAELNALRRSLSEAAELALRGAAEALTGAREALRAISRAMTAASSALSAGVKDTSRVEHRASCHGPAGELQCGGHHYWETGS